MITRRFLAIRHSFGVEAASVLLMYAVYEGSRGLVKGSRRIAIDHAQTVTSLERGLHVFVEPNVQNAAQGVPGLMGLLGGAYLTLHLAVTAALLLWLHQRRPAVYARVRTTLFIASAIALAVFVSFPTAPPRLASIGVADTISSRHVDLNHGLISSLYNPFAAVPSLHMGYALVVGATVMRYAHTRLARVVGGAYSLFVLIEIVATGNHFLFDAATGALVALLAYRLAVPITNAGNTMPAAPPVRRLPEVTTVNVRDLEPPQERIAA
jgi:PAP2 superfamily